MSAPAPFGPVAVVPPPVAVVADAHLGGPGGTADLLVAQLDALPVTGCRRLVLLGDLCQLWIGDRRYETPEIVALVACLRRLREKGVWIDYVEGNRDFFLDRSPWADAFDQVVTEVAFETAGVRYLVIHGDGLDERDWKYRAWRRLSKSAPARWFACHLPRKIANRLVRGTEATLSKTNRQHKRHIPEDALRAYGERRLREGGHDVLLLGHFHEPHTFDTPAGTVRLLDAWFRSRRVEWLGDDGD